MNDNNTIDNIQRLDDRKFNEIKDILEDGFADIISTFENTVTLSLETMKIAVEEGNTEKLFIESHTLKSSSGNLGLSRLSQLCFVLETQARNNEIIEPNAQIQLIENEFLAGMTAINTKL